MIKGFKIGHYTDQKALTGCTVILCPEGAVCGVDVRGGAPGTRETDLLSPTCMVEKVHALVLSGGSAFGLAAADGVMRYLEEKGIGFDTRYARVPIVPAAILFDLNVGDPKVRPGPQEGYEACRNASSDEKTGSVGAGTGATVGKILGPASMMKAGLGAHKMVLAGQVEVEALVAVNAFGDVIDRDGSILAGAYDAKTGFLNTTSFIMGHPVPPASQMENTTLGVVMTNVKLNKSQATKVAQMAQEGLATAIPPVHHQYGGDHIFV
ncbi:P1 family peptidase, partial [Candidatus Hakubella thermalkaliphila]